MYAIVILLVLLIMLYYFYPKQRNETFIDMSDYIFTKPSSNINGIPKIIWTYWHDLTQVPTLVSKCIDTWIYHNKEYIINILDDTKFKNLTNIDIDESFSITNTRTHQKKSDFIRLNIIYLFGGIWLDASIICGKSLDWLYQHEVDFIGYNAPNSNDIIDSWFMAAIPRSLLIHDSLAEFNKSLSYTNDKDYCTDMIKQYPVPSKIIELLPYITIQLCMWIPYYLNKYKIFLLSSTAISEPFYFINKYNWNSISMYRSFIKNPIIEHIKLLKLTHGMRKTLYLFNKKYRTNNPYLNYVLNE